MRVLQSAEDISGWGPCNWRLVSGTCESEVAHKLLEEG